MSRRLLASAFLAASVLTSARAAPPPTACPPTTEPDAEEALPLLGPALKAGGRLDVLIVGSASFESHDDYAHDMAQTLQAKLHGLHVNLTFNGRRFMSAPDLQAVLAASLAHHRYALVIWQTGTADAVRNEPLGDFYQALSDGAAAAASANAAMVLVDPQYSEFLAANADIGPYVSAMQAIASTSGVLLFDRFALMRDWAASDAIDLEHADAADRPAVAARLHACLGQALAETILAAVTPAP